MLAPDLADLYQVETRVFNQSVKRNIKRFPDNFRFQLTKDELDEVIINCDNPDRLRFSPQAPFAFTEQGIAMLSGVLNSDVAVQVSIRIMNTFVAMRRTLASIAPLLSRIEATERRQLKLEDWETKEQARKKATHLHLSPSPKLLIGNIGNWQHFHTGNITFPIPNFRVFRVFRGLKNPLLSP